MKNKLIVGTALGIAAIAATVDHTRHRLPEPVAEAESSITYSDESPCGLDVSPCGLESPCGLDASPCSL
ncbi:MAG: hypothetical protein PVF52_04865 [Granulosicoccaceae bacterium]